MTGQTRFATRLATGLLAVAIAAVPFQAARALITGGEGNKPIADPGWPRGAAASSTTRPASPGGKGRRSAAASGTPSAAAMPGR